MSELPWWVCAACGRNLDRHSSRTVPNRGGREYVCSQASSGRFEPGTGRHDYDPEYGLKLKDPARSSAHPPAPPVSSPARPARREGPRKVRYEDVHWGTHGCELFGEMEGERCPHGAELLVLDPGSWSIGTPACWACADALIERQELGRALSSAPVWW